MHPKNKGLRFLFLLLNISLLFCAVFISNYFNPTTKSNINLYLLHAVLAILITYTLYSKKKNYFFNSFTRSFKDVSLRMLMFVFLLLFWLKYFYLMIIQFCFYCNMQQYFTYYKYSSIMYSTNILNIKKGEVST